MARASVREQQIETAILNWLKYRGIFAFKIHNGASFNQKRGRFIFGKNRTAGIADIVGCYKGRFFCIEVKSEKGVLSEEQQRFLNNVHLNDGLLCVARSIDDVEKFIYGRLKAVAGE